jgi:hypothetical protein
MKQSVTVFALVLALAAGPFALAGFQIDQVTTHSADCSAPDVASSPDGLTMVAYGLDGYPLLMHFAATQLVPTHPEPGETWPAPVTVGPGRAPKICWSREGFIVAVNSGEMIVVYESDLEGNWSTAEETLLDPGGVVMGIDLWGAPGLAAGPYAFMTVQVSTNPPSNDFKVLYSAVDAINGWSDFEVVHEEASLMPNPQMTIGIGPAGPWPRIFYLSSNDGGVDLVYTTKDLADGWDTPTVVPGDGGSAPSPIQGSFDVVTSFGMSHNVLGLGAQPTCPCGTVHFLSRGLGGSWAPEVDMTVDHLTYDWPRSPRLGASLADPQGQVHAFWMQVGSGPDLEAKTKNLEYWINAPGGWYEAGGFLDGQDGGPLGSYVGLDVSPNNAVVMAWTRRDTLQGVPQPQQVWMARAGQPADVPEGELSVEPVSLEVWPNPFNPVVTLAMEFSAAGRGTLDIFDVRGRRVVRLFEGDLRPGRREVRWNGEDSTGRGAPSGVYFARLSSGANRAVAKLVLAE